MIMAPPVVEVRTERVQTTEEYQSQPRSGQYIYYIQSISTSSSSILYYHVALLAFEKEMAIPKGVATDNHYTFLVASLTHNTHIISPINQ